MDIFVRNLPINTNHQEVRTFLRSTLSQFDIVVFDVIKNPDKRFATITIADENKAQSFLTRCGSHQARHRLHYRGAPLTFVKSNLRGQPDALKVRVLLREEEEWRAKGSESVAANLTLPRFHFASLATGIWTYDKHGRLTFDQKYYDPRDGTITFGRNAMVIFLRKGPHEPINYHERIDIKNSIVEHSIPSMGQDHHCIIYITTIMPPRIYEVQNENSLRYYTGEHDIVQGLMALKVEDRGKQMLRRCNIRADYRKNAGLCMVYRLVVTDADQALQIWAFLKHTSAVPRRNCFKITVPEVQSQTIEQDLASLDARLANGIRELDFACRFQLLSLVLEGILSPTLTHCLLPHLEHTLKANKCVPKTMADAISKLRYQLPTPNWNLCARDLSITSILKLVKSNINSLQESASTSKDILQVETRHHHLTLTYKATVTPTGMLLSGPDIGVTNRVLRKYSTHSDYFMRVRFAEEDGSGIVYDSRASQEQIYARFRQVLQGGIQIAGRTYEFLGFSHSSLHYHTAWFMAPLRFGHGPSITARDVIQDLGHFSHLHCSAKCAARIGQAFSDTLFAIPLSSDVYVNEDLEDVKRNGHVFSDGCGTISLDLLQAVWRRLPSERQQQKPTVLQIRYRGAKGVVSLDTSLPGKQLLIRKSMKKFEATEGWRDIEICGASYKPLTLFLNQQFIKILEDLGVSLSNFLQVQNDALRELNMILQNPLNTANFLEYCRSGISAGMPTLLRLLNDIGLSFQADAFLANMVQIVAFATLRDMKYRARIPVKDGVLLYGIMDESGELKEGEVYIATRAIGQDGKFDEFVLVQDRVVVTRAPALHPGDIQVVKAVNLPHNFRLKALFNCIVFSKHGVRDLPSQLGGGDLDGDLFHIIYDRRLIPPRTASPSEYAAAPAKDLGRSVQREDIIDFFVEYMHSDRLGQISNMHKVLADQAALGTEEPNCILLAELASVAVDYTKSGNPVSMDNVPRGYYNIRPDFMNGGGSSIGLKDQEIVLEAAQAESVHDPDIINLIDPSTNNLRYYRSPRSLGVLYREIDETKFFRQMNDNVQAARQSMNHESLMEKLDRYIDREASFLQWEHYRNFAEQLRQVYEDTMLDIMHSYQIHRGEPLGELEVFSGNIFGSKMRNLTRHVREANNEVREQFNRHVSAVLSRIVHGDGDGDEEDEALPRAIACFKIARETEKWENSVNLKSFEYVTAGCCLERLWVYQGCHLRRL
ncbi:rna-dependent rna polymeras-like protein [Lojkania enalia]|uniref:RNA-dependent RNA polymerase n=1 Tax=Lojkania enalia TaxID=147567 RepID=A0A9P4K1X6_9PLEO|nr:rna-dependent rna polymeras-like protein [Didymosphaeria enalia]